jgi:hypothetical protein
MSSIPLAALHVQPAEQPDILGSVSKIMQLRGLTNQNQLQNQAIQEGGLQIEAQKRANQERQTIMQAQADAAGDPKKYLPALQGKINPSTYAQLIEQDAKTRKELADADTATRNNLKAKNDQLLGLVNQAKNMSPEQYAQSWPQIIQSAEEIHPGTTAKYGLDPSKPVPQESLAGITVGLQSADQYFKQAEEDAKAAKRPFEQKKAEADAASALSDSTTKAAAAAIAPQKTAAELVSSQAAAKTAQEKARLGIGGVAATEAAGRVRGEMGAMGGGPGASGGSMQPNQNLQPGQRDEAYLQTLQGNLGTTVKAIAEGRMPLPSGFALKSPYWQNMLAMVAKYDPSFDAVNYNARAATRRDFTSGKSAAQINALNTVAGHLASLSSAADALNNRWSPTWNTIANAFETGSGDARVKQFETTKNAVADELTRVWRQSGGSEADIQSWNKQLDSAGSPKQLHGVIAQIGELLQSKLDSMGSQYGQGMGTSPVKVITPHAEQTIQKLQQKAGRIGAPESGAQSNSTVTVRAPNGKDYTFPDQASADKFKAQAQIQ